MRIKAIPLGIVFVFLLIEVFLYPVLPEIMVTHWNFEGQADGSMSKFWFNVFFSLLTVGIYGLFILIPKIDPLKKNFSKFINYYYGMVILFTGFMLYIYLIVVAANFGYPLDIQLVVVPAASALIFYGGFLCEKSKRNWFVGIRTPWTLSSDSVWEKTNRLGGKLLEAFAVLLFLSIFFIQNAVLYFVFVLIFPLISILVFTIVYSYFEYRKEEKGTRKKKR